MSRHDLMIDFETMGTNAQNCAVVELSTFVFEWDRFGNNPYSYNEVLDNITKYKFNVEDQVRNYGFKLEKETVEWWASLPKEVRRLAIPSDNDLTLPQFTDQFLADLYNGPKIEYWWSRNNTFDPTVLWRLVWTQGAKYRLNEYLTHWRVRDVKTWIDAKFNFTTRSGFCPFEDEELFNSLFKQHDSAHDVVADVLRLQAIFRAENDLEHINR
jgi:hypothetical protein